MSGQSARPTNAEIMGKIDAILIILGKEGEDGKSGTGLVGKVARIDVTVQGHDRLAATLRGGFVATGALIVVIWWLVKDKLSRLFGLAT